jgi:hypothetical protein
MKNPEEVFLQIKENVIRLFEKDLESQIILHAKHRVRKKLEATTDRKIGSVEELAAPCGRKRKHCCSITLYHTNEIRIK